MQAVLEIRYPASLSVDCRKDKFYEQISGQFPVIKLPELSPLEPYLAQPISYYSQDETKNLFASATKFSYVTRAYRQYKDFKSEAMPIVENFIEAYKIKKIARIGLRYINHIGTISKKAGIDYGQVLDISFKVPSSIRLGSLKDFQTVFVCNFENNGTIRTLIGSAKQAGPDNVPQDIIVIDNDISFAGSLEPASLSGLSDKAHEEAERIFVELMRKEYIESFGVEGGGSGKTSGKASRKTKT